MYDIVTDLAPDGKGIPWDKMDPSEEALESLSAEVYNSPSKISKDSTPLENFIFGVFLYSLQYHLSAAEALWEERCPQRYEIAGARRENL